MGSFLSRIAVINAVVVAASASGTFGAQIVDAPGDLINGFSAATSPDLDVLQAEVFYNNVTNTFTFTSTQAGNVGTTAGASYVWGVDRGAGTAGFAANGLPNVLFDRLVRLVPGGTSQIIGGGLPAIDLDPGAVTINGATITAVVPVGSLPSTGFSFENYTVNLWPRVTTPTGFPGIGDFAPNTNNASVTVVPTPATAALFGVGGMMIVRRRNR